MRRTVLLLGLWGGACCAGLLIAAAPAVAQGEGAPVAPQAALALPQAAAAMPPAEARQWLLRVQQAARQGNYEGTLVSSSQDQLRSVRVRHYWVGEQAYEHLESLDGRPHRIVRHNARVQTQWPQQRVAVVELRQALPGWGSTPQDIDPQAQGSYELREEGQSRVAGREAQVVRLQPRDALRYAQRLWADRATGLMLRADVLAATAEMQAVIQSHAFTEIDVGVRPRPEQVLQQFERLEGYRVMRPQQQATTLDAEGWLLARPVPGFVLAGSVRRGMEAAGEGPPVLQTVFSDGLTHVSLFVEPFHPERHRQAWQGQRGATAALSLRQHGHWLTVVGDVPLATLRLFAQALQRRPP